MQEVRQWGCCKKMNDIRFLRIFSIALMLVFVVFTRVDVFAASDGYQLGPTDILSVSIFAGGELQVAVDLTISEQGFINFPFLGAVKAAGMTSSEMEKLMVVPLEKDYFVDPQIHIQIKEYHSLHFFISGAVNKPGKYEMQAATTIMDLIAKAEGLTLESGNVAYIMREGKEAYQSSGDSTQAQDGIEAVEPIEVNGLALESSNVANIMREGKEASQAQDGIETVEPIKVNLIQLLDKGDMRHNVALAPGDSVYIPFAKGLNQSDSKVYVSGEVEKPALYEYQPGMSALSVCIMAGGFAKYAAPNRTTIVRTENGEQKVMKIDLEDVVKGKIPDVPLKPGDRIHVPESWL